MFTEFVESRPLEHLTIEASGYLVVTSRRIFFTRKRDDFFAKYTLAWGVDLKDIKSVSEDNYRDLDRLNILEENGHNARFVGKHSKTLMHAIEEAKAKRISEIEASRKRGTVVVSIDFSALKDYMQRGGLVLTVVKCPHCGGTIKMPESGGSVQCEFCRSTVLAVDLFKKIKDLIG